MLYSLKLLNFRRLSRTLLLPVFIVLSVQSSYGQEPAWDEVITICNENYELEAQITSGGAGGTGWQLLEEGSGTFNPQNNKVTTVSGIGLGENWYYYDGPGGHEYYIKVVRVEPPVFTLSGPETFCGSADIITLTLSGSDIDYYYNLYLNGTFFAGTHGTGGPISWETDQTGTYTAEAELSGATSDCSIMMDGTVDVIIAPLPDIYQLDAPLGTDFCAGSSAVLTLDDSDTGISYQLYLGTGAYGTSRGGTGDPITWNVTEEGSYHVVATDNNSGCQETMEGPVTLAELPAPVQYDFSPASASYCGESGGIITLTLAGSQTDVNYQLLRYGTEGPVEVKAGGNRKTLGFR